MPSKIQWTDETWSPITGCNYISEGCLNCYAKKMAQRLKGRFGYPDDDPFAVTFHKDKMSQPLKWKKSRKVFVCSMGDIFHDHLRIEQIAAVFGMMSFCPDHTFIVLTKREDRMKYFFSLYSGDHVRQQNWWRNEAVYALDSEFTQGIRLRGKVANEPLPNVWIGVSAENQKRADERIPILLQIPAAVRFVSIEPMLGPVDFDAIPKFDIPGNDEHRTVTHYEAPWDEYLDWVIAGCESGTGRRIAPQEWFRTLKDQCVESGTPFFLKQMDGRSGGWPTGKIEKMPGLDGQIWDQYPE